MMNVPANFRNSYANADQYPLNLINQSVSPARANQYQNNLNNSLYRLCIDDHTEADRVKIHFRDWIYGNTAWHKSDLFDDVELAEWLGDKSALLPVGDSVTKADPRCRFIFLASPTGRDALTLTTHMLRRILSYHQVPAEYLDYLSLFGEREDSSDLKFGNFVSYRSLSRPSPNLIALDLGRSGQHYEMCFNLKGAEARFPDTGVPAELDQWSIRHAAIYHKFDVTSGNALWVITKATWSLKGVFRDATGDGSGPNARTFDDVKCSYRSSLAAHLLIAKWAGESWWRFLQCLEKEIEQKTQDALLVSGDAKSSNHNGYPIYTRRHLQEVIFYGEKATEVAIVLNTNIAVLKAIREFYAALLKDPDFPLAQDVELATKSFNGEIEHLQTEMQGFATRAQYLISHANNRKELVLNLMQAQNADNMTDMTRRSIEEAITMRIITVVTLIFLPATFVSTFFSTDIVKYQPSSEGEPYHTQYSSLAMNRWLQVTLPLTLVTLAIAVFLYLLAKRPLRKLDILPV